MKIYKFIPLLATMGLTVGSCVDSDYDLSDIDTTARVSVNDLVIPINIDAIELSSVLDIDPDGNVQVLPSGEYAYVKNGTFSSSQITIPDVSISAAAVEPIDATPTLPINSGDFNASMPTLTVDLPHASKPYKFSASNITEDVCGLSSVRGSFDVELDIDASGLEPLAESVRLEGLQIQLPAGIDYYSLSGGSYDPSTGVLSVSDFSGKSLHQHISIHARGLEIPSGAFNEYTHSIDISGNIGILAGELVVEPTAQPSYPYDFKLSISAKFGNIHVTEIDGVLKHSIADVQIPDIDITDLPDVLAQEGTNLILNNPRIYLDVENPVGLSAQTGLTAYAYHGAQSDSYSIDDAFFTINPHYSKLMLSPLNEYSDGYTHVPFTTLSYVLSGDGLPDKLSVVLTDPNVPRQDVKSFQIGHNYGAITGTYRFEAPLSFKDGSQIMYTDRIDGWSSDDLDAVTIERLEVSMTVSTDVPINVELTAQPIDKNGHPISGVSVQPVHIDSHANNQEVMISVSGTIRNLDGIDLEARAYTNGESALRPDMHITLKNVRPCVSGYYEKEL